MKYVYLFDEGNKDMREILGGKGANLAEMMRIGLPVPSGFTVSTDACTFYYNNQEMLSENIEKEIRNAVEIIESKTGKKFGDINNPLLLSVRSGARISMPGMMDSILNLGLNEKIVEVYGEKIGNKRFMYDSYRRLIEMYADVVMGYNRCEFEKIIDDIKAEKNVKLDNELDEVDMKKIVEMFKQKFTEFEGKDFPSEPYVQLFEAIKAVFKSWNNERAIYYRKINNIPNDWGTAVNVQQMVYGNLNENSGTGVAFTRNPATGEEKLFGEYLMNAQGEDVVAGVRTPESIEKLKEVNAEIYEEFAMIAEKLEKHYKDMQDMEFTIEDGKLYILQTRNGKRTPAAAIKIAVSLVEEGIITKEEALFRVDENSLDALLHPTFNIMQLQNEEVFASGLAASPGAGVGVICFDAKKLIENKRENIPSILVRTETSPEDIEGMHSSEGVLTVRGGMTSHAAVVARGMGIPCVSGANIVVDEVNRCLKNENGKVLHEGDYISVDGSTGNVYAKKIELVDASISGDFEKFMSWAKEIKRLGVLANADTVKDANMAKNFGAEGIGLCRSEHMFFDKKRIFSFRKMICASTKEEREKALEEILPYQREDFEGLFTVMSPNKVVVRYLDPPLHEFLPKTKEEVAELASSLGKTVEELEEIISSLKEFNPMMGHRGCRLAITYPEIAEMQTRALIEAAVNVYQKGVLVEPEIMIPLVGDEEELKYVKGIVVKTASSIIEKAGVDIKYKIGTMIELPRAALLADKLANEADFFSFGSNDLTQLTYGFSRDDAGKFLKDYYEKNIFKSDPFASIDEAGVGALIQMGVNKGRMVKPNISLGICGEHGGDPKSIEFCDKIGLDYVSCSPFRVPVAILAAAKSAIKNKN